MRIFMKNSDGQPSVSLTMVVISFNVVTLWLLVWIVGSALGWPIPEFDVASAMGYLTPQLGLYFGRKFTAKQDATSKVTEVSMESRTVTTAPAAE